MKFFGLKKIIDLLLGKFPLSFLPVKGYFGKKIILEEYNDRPFTS